jgi:transcriptional regulator GlxA family with amidase domain
LIRRFKQSTGDTPMAYLQKLRIEKAKQLLESSQLPIEQLLNVVGYEDLSSFRKLFQQYTSLTPKAYRERFYLT